MSLYDRRAILGGLGLALLGLPGCLRPMLAKGGAAAELRGRVAFPTIDDRFGYFLNESLLSRLGRTGTAEYRLEISRTIKEAGVAIARDSSATRTNLLVEASWRLVRVSDGKTLMSDELLLQSGYNATTSLYATRQTRRDIERRLARSLGERIARTVQARANEIDV